MQLKVLSESIINLVCNIVVFICTGGRLPKFDNKDQENERPDINDGTNAG